MTSRQKFIADTEPDDMLSDFENFWAAYPKLRRVAKGKARGAYQRAIKRLKARGVKEADAVELILLAVAEFAMSSFGKGRFCPGPEPWLNGDRWDDDREAWKYESLEDVPRAEKQVPKMGGA